MTRVQCSVMSLAAATFLRIQCTARTVAAYVSNHKLPTSALPATIVSVFQAFGGIPDVDAEERKRPAVPINQSVTADYIICLENGRRFKVLTKYLRSTYRMSPNEYRQKWGLPGNYPMVAPNHSARLSASTKSIHAQRKTT